MADSSRSTLPSYLPWVIWSCGALGFFYAFFQRVAPSVMVTDLMRDFGVSAAVLGNLSAFYFYSYATMQIPVGIMADRWGPRRVMCIAAILCAAGSLLFATAETLLFAYAGRLLIGCGAGFFFVSTLKLASIWFEPKKFAFVSGMTMLIGLAGGVGGQAPLATAVEIFGWRGTMIAGAIAALVLSGLIWVLVRDHPDNIRDANQQKISIGQVLSGLSGAIKKRQTWLLSAMGACMSSSLLAFGALWCVPYLMQVYGLSRPAAAGSASLLLVGWGISAPAIGWISDRIGRRKIPLVVSAFISMASITYLIYGPAMPLSLVNLLLIINGASSAGMVVCFALARENNSSHMAGGAVAFVNMGVMLAGAILQPAIGWLLDQEWDGTVVAGVRIYTEGAYETAFVFLVGAGMCSFLVSLFIKETYCRPVGS
jgi:predicted MFS family arabinose efflux permease